MVLICFSLMVNDVEHVFMLLICYPYVLFVEVSISFLLQFLSCVVYIITVEFWEFFILCMSPLLVVYYKHFLQFVTCLSIILTASFIEQNLKTLRKPNLSFFFLMDSAFGIISTNLLFKDFFLCFLLYSFIFYICILIHSSYLCISCKG